MRQVKVEDPVCRHCGEPFELKPKLQKNDWTKLSSLLDKYAENNKELERIRITSKKIMSLKTKDPLNRPVCYIDVANIAFGNKSHLGNAPRILDFVGKIYEHFSVIALVSKFGLPHKYYQQLNQLRTIFYETSK